MCKGWKNVDILGTVIGLEVLGWMNSVGVVNSISDWCAGCAVSGDVGLDDCCDGTGLSDWCVDDGLAYMIVVEVLKWAIAIEVTLDWVEAVVGCSGLV